MDNINTKSIAETIFDKLGSRLDENSIQTEDDIIMELDQYHSQIVGRITKDTDCYQVFFDDSSVLTLDLLCEGDKIVEIDIRHGYKIAKKDIN